MADTAVSRPSSAVARPVSEALLNEKVHDVDFLYPEPASTMIHSMTGEKTNRKQKI